MNGSIGTETDYNEYYDLITEKNVIGNLSESTYSNIANSNYYGNIMWILDQAYVPTGSNNSDKIALLAKAGIVGGQDLGYSVIAGDITGYGYVAQTGYDYSSFVTYGNPNGYYYRDVDGNQVDVLLSDEQVEAVQQAAIWYYTNYKDNNSAKIEEYNWYTAKTADKTKNWLFYTDDQTNTNSNLWDTLSDYKVEGYSLNDSETTQVDVGLMLQEQASILYNYLVDSAENNKTAYESQVQAPVSAESTTMNVEKSGSNYIAGPIKIKQNTDLAYKLDDKIIVKDQNGNEISGAYISDSTGNRIESTVQNLVGQDFYVTVPKTGVTKITIGITGTYNTTIKKLWVSNSSNVEQPIVEVKKGSKDIEIEVAGTPEREFDLALRKAIVSLSDSQGVTKQILNEDRQDTQRDVTYQITTETTATYNHRKRPVVVENGDIVKYELKIYNEGDKPGYATTIVDKLPEGLALNGYTANGTTKGTYTSESGKVRYTYVYDAQTNEITFTNESKNVLAEYDGGSSLSEETIEIECEVVKEPSENYIYLTNIAYIAKEYNEEDSKTITGTEIGEDRDSSPGTYPSSTQVIEKENKNSYDGYVGGSAKTVYDDSNNTIYYPGMQDDDDFEVIVLEPKIIA